MFAEYRVFVDQTKYSEEMINYSQFAIVEIRYLI
jgi:hypothetical protein